ncbi:MAG: 50S ribosomal protein L23 [Gammaproteobacteria bacterium]|nr:50S ribosomal protein L23 [Gammaproteobacteria bacterium]NIR84186.1 50S ribosomal protein L23 [Gammaproteobacteria bacterium]NIR89656.1 50S ribosomal protein L23 [Gammaproteobacteria bacterium]NIU05344.1 50S ribosomal protein L23 [Gammaproteobacteria bacterium]NIV52290.1 50S ribosomal protein L23 [Gammaproteobacteria bacterium]
MNQERLMRVLLAPHVSEKGTRVADLNRQVVFKVRRDATKPEIKKAVEQLFDVQVERVQVLNLRGKRKAFGRVAGRRSDWKKAYVKLKPGHDIDFMGGD